MQQIKAISLSAEALKLGPELRGHPEWSIFGQEPDQESQAFPNQDLIYLMLVRPKFTVCTNGWETHLLLFFLAFLGMFGPFFSRELFLAKADSAFIPSTDPNQAVME